MTARVGNITFDCVDALAVGRFWSEVLGRPLDPGADHGFASIGVSDDARVEPAWLFERVPETKTSKNRMHVDLVDADPDAPARLVGLGATIVDDHAAGTHSWTVLKDPEGNEFCISTGTYSA